MSSRDLRLHATVTELLAYLGVEDDPSQFLSALSLPKSQSQQVVDFNVGSNNSIS
jgi:hypothetical protein